MSTIPDGSDAADRDSTPAPPGRLCFLVVGIVAGTVLSVTASTGLADDAQLHLLLIG